MANALQNSPAEVVRKVLVAVAAVQDPNVGVNNWPCYVASEPDEDKAPSNLDNIVTIYDTEGRVQARQMIDGATVEHHGLQFRVRARHHTAGYAKAAAIAKALDEQATMREASFTVGATTYLYRLWSVGRTSSILALGHESPTSKRRIFTFNALAALELYATVP